MKSIVPDTRNSLLLLLPNLQDVEAWDQFVEIYDPLIYRLARTRGLQDADARELVQEVFVAVSRAIDRWDPNAEHGRFRDWLFRISRNLLINHLTRRKYRSIASSEESQKGLEQWIDPASQESARFDLEYGRQVFRWASDRVQRQVSPKTWRAFWDTSVAGFSMESTAQQLDMSVGALHIARSRVLGRLRSEVQKLLNNHTSLSNDVSMSNFKSSSFPLESNHD